MEVCQSTLFEEKVVSYTKSCLSALLSWDVYAVITVSQQHVCTHSQSYCITAARKNSSVSVRLTTLILVQLLLPLK